MDTTRYTSKILLGRKLITVIAQATQGYKDSVTKILKGVIASNTDYSYTRIPI